ncbi:chemotaxis protein CheW [[Bacillus] enclensis]|jgi:purine-binding chemotaxis protein CheW|uniref:Chemotaxis protein CheW n=2 Tax=Rossellomorea TaxID=2837508 RepID=A0A0V8HJL5_9BACI|nr:chemotaxis protein CheW [[Bacillus] enclensis]OAT82820.1 chemotaxis protein CheW [Bacillus sp. MKU004]QTC42428.1 chemotaxis protein CheW [Bacillus sp. V3]QWC24494.1 chemotaxis protein CheW [Bacillus haikouensis]KSU62535.1 chemotaxis protein CheW [[Bacillus] enclensis]SCC06015.1 purine-binding chemotaxis protein CheW [[Bacillus] enclensis]
MNETTTITEDLKLIVFQLVDKEYAIPVNQVRSIEKLEHITRVPKTPAYVKGVINLRGVVTPIIDLRSKFGLSASITTESTRVIIAGSEDKEVGLIVDAANDVLDVSKEAVEPPPEVVGVVEAEYIGGVVKKDRRLLILLHLDKILEAL